MNDNDFYVVLPSNSNSSNFPENNASKYIVDFNRPIEFTELHKWQVALTEISFYVPQVTATPKYGIQIEYLSPQYDVSEINYEMEFNDAGSELIFVKMSGPDSQTVAVDHRRHRTGVLIWSRRPFTIFFANAHDARRFGYLEDRNSLEAINDGGTFAIECPNIKNLNAEPAVNKKFVIQGMKFQLQKPKLLSTVTDSYLDKNYHWNNIDELVNTLKTFIYVLFYKEPHIKDGEKLIIFSAKLIHRVTFLNGFNYILGFKDKTYLLNENIKTIVAEFPPQLNRGIDHLYIYSSVCEPIQVGDSRVPLLKSVWLESKKDFQREEVRNINIQKPMYLPISSSSINTIEINIRTDSGSFVPFSETAITSITLHFKKHRHHE
jgi:hypothetical protein